MKDWKRKLLAKEWLLTMLMGIIVHFAICSNWLTNPDGMATFGEYYAGDWETSLGRFLLPVVDRIRDGMNAPFLNAVYGVALFALAAVLVNEVFNIEKPLVRCLMAISMISTSLVANLVTYYYTFVAYGIAMVAAVYSVYFILSHKSFWAILISSLLLMVSLGLYQSGLAVAVSLCAMVMVIELFRGNKTLKEIAKLCARFVIYGIIGVVLYYGILNVILAVKNISISNYTGIGTFGIRELITNIPLGIKQAYCDFYAYFCDGSIQANAYMLKEIYLILAAFVGGAVLILLWRNRKKVCNSLCAVALLAAMPVFCNCTVLVAAGTSIVLRTAWGMFMVVPFAIALIIEASGYVKEKILKANIGKIVDIFTCLVLVAMCMSNASIVNMDALVMKIVDNKYMSLANRICIDIENEEHYQNGGRVAVIGVPEDGNYSLHVMNNHASYIDGYECVYNKTNQYAHWGLVWKTKNMIYSGWKEIFVFKLGMRLNWCEQWEFDQICEMAEFEAMPVYPLDGSIAVINDVLVVKISDCQ